MRMEPKDFLRRIVERRRQLKSAYSLRAFARDLGMSHSHLSRILNGKKPVAYHQAIRLAKVLEFAPEERQHFLDSVNEQIARSPSKKRHRRPPSVARLKTDQFRIISDWYHTAILELMLLPRFQPSFSWIARALGISAQEAEQAVERLVRLGLVVKSEHGWRRQTNHLIIPTAVSIDAIRKFHEQMIRKALRQLEPGAEGEFGQRDITGTTMALDPSKLAEAKRRLKRFRTRLMQFVGEDSPGAVYQLNIQFFPLVPQEGAGR